MKKGITLSILVITIVIMTAIIGTTAVVGTKAIKTASYEEFMGKLNRVSDDVNQYVVKNKKLPTTSEIIAKEGLSQELLNKLTINGDNNNNLFVIDMTLLRTESVNIGKGNISNMDIFVVAENTNNVYYLKGVKYKGNIYYGI